MKILIIDDEEFICEILKNMIRKLRPQAEVVTAFDYASGLRELRNCAFDFVLTDHSLDQDKQGLNLLKEINKNGDPPAACLMSGFLPKLDNFDYGNSFFSLRKPFKEDDLNALLDIVYKP